MSAKLNDPQHVQLLERHRLLWFALIGGIATVTHLGAALILLNLIGLPPLLSNIVAFFLAFAVSFFGHYKFTFGDMAQDLARAMGRFFITAAFGFLINNGVLVLLLAAGLLSPAVSIMIAVLIVPVLTYLLARFWAFRKS